MDEFEPLANMFNDPDMVRKHMKKCSKCKDSLTRSFRVILDRVIRDEEAQKVIFMIRDHSGDL